MQNVGDVKHDFKVEMASKLLNMDAENVNHPKILNFNNKPVLKARAHPSKHDSQLRKQFEHNLLQNHQSAPRLISSSPDKILDAPELLDDYYLNLLDWSSTDILAVGLGSCLYLWNGNTGDIDLLVENSSTNNITSISWAVDGVHLAVGTNEKQVMVWNVETKQKIRTMNDHIGRVGSLAWNNNLLASGSRDAMIFVNDSRMPSQQHATLLAHDEEICGLTWSPDGSQLASGGNDNLCCVWDKSSIWQGGVQPRYTFSQHKAAVKALSWCPWQKNILATGGGTLDRCIRFFNTSTGTLLNTVDTRSQVCSLLWSETERELLSAHGFSQNQLTVWKYPAMQQIACLTGHSSRVLHTALSPDGTTVCSAAADETLRFWKVWPAKKARSGTPRKTGKDTVLEAVVR
jgi:cell division cycle protein 20 (cofactor of APC complex)